MVLGFTKGMMVDGKRRLTNFEDKIKMGIKLHTIRWDSKDRWEIGKKIHFATGVRTSRYNCFKEGVCKGTQKIRIEGRTIWIDNVIISQDEVDELIVNDGFDNEKDFWAWFDQYSPFTGKIIHWSNLLY